MMPLTHPAPIHILRACQSEKVQRLAKSINLEFKSEIVAIEGLFEDDQPFPGRSRVVVLTLLSTEDKPCWMEGASHCVDDIHFNLGRDE